MNDDTLFDEISCEELFCEEPNHEALLIEVSGEEEQERQLLSDEECGLEQLYLSFDPIE